MSKGMFHSFHARIFATMLLVAVVPIVLCMMLMLPLMISSSERRQAQSAREQLAAMEERLDSAFAGADAALRALCASGEVARAAGGDGDGREAYAAMVEAASLCPQAGNLFVLSPEGACVLALRGGEELPSRETDWGILRMAADGETAFAAAQQAGGVEAARRLEDGGYVIALIGQEQLTALLQDTHDPAAGVLLLSPQWRLIAGTQGAADRLEALRGRFLGQQPLTDDDFTYSTRQEPLSGFTLVLSQPRVFTAEVTGTVQVVGLAMGAVSLALCVLAALVLSRSLSRPIREMTDAMERTGRGEHSVRVQVPRDDELGVLAGGFNRMAEEVEENLRRTVERQRELNETRIRMMQAQLNPHFLYNTLDSMKWMGVTHGVPQVATLAEDLAAILRTSISGDEFVTLDCELELLERYIDIQLIRFADRFACEIEIDDALMGLMVPKLVLQPIVENAVIHGVRDMDDGYIKVYARREGDELHLFVQDNGRGMATEPGGALGFGVSGRPGEHLGLYNVDSILRLHFGDAYGLSVRSRPGEGCLVLVRLPVLTAAPGHETNGSAPRPEGGNTNDSGAAGG